MNPHMAEDITVLQQYLTSNTTARRAPSKLYSTISTGPGGGPVVYLTVPKRRRGLRNAMDSGRAQREVIENVLGPFASEVRKVYFEHLHPSFPVLDEKTFSDMWHEDSDRISSTIVCDLYASALRVWSRSAVLYNQPRPDPHFIWNQAVTALQDDFMAPTISTVHAAVLDLLGRPVIGVTGNIVNAGRIVTLAQSLGLHRDPSSWKITSHEKSVRINLWWGVLIHDYWSSIGHGIPPAINPQYYDVPVPTFGNTAGSDDQAQANMRDNSTFVQLCKLSQILGDILPLIKRRLRKTDSTTPCAVNGCNNLWFACLSLKVLVCRLSFKAVLEEASKSFEARQYHLAMLRDAASEVVDSVVSLTEAQLQEFWMPYTSYLLVTSATILLRCTIKSNDLVTKKTCVAKLWGLADFCLERCNEPIQKVADAIGMRSLHPSAVTPFDEATVSPSRESDLRPNDSVFMSDLFLPIDSLDYPWETLWDGIEGPWSIQL
ncbi:hypothetical protein BU25DRAFT_428951 [Macroventuria anomochaeta]|uniref:Uncharacterized protein n=1 Tax=Macroventuria anomochaeta TaxID=301207 RepID=A0ACB6SCB4_9PLEO|nr:uncharacterized protein BU25DRAFT_428951 [Macroventuria anomochaeta]KAF2631240.1 hypothetical protein BU25DRAFT_428951 [Macroventuria anomochaeta]